MTTKVISGSKDKKILSFRLHKLSTYGILAAYTERELIERINFLIAENVLSAEEGKFPTLKLNQKSGDVLKGNQPVWIFSERIPKNEEVEYQDELLTMLRTLRQETS